MLPLVIIIFLGVVLGRLAKRKHESSFKWTMLFFTAWMACEFLLTSILINFFGIVPEGFDITALSGAEQKIVLGFELAGLAVGIILFFIFRKILNDKVDPFMEEDEEDEPQEEEVEKDLSYFR